MQVNASAYINYIYSFICFSVVFFFFIFFENIIENSDSIVSKFSAPLVVVCRMFCACESALLSHLSLTIPLFFLSLFSLSLSLILLSFHSLSLSVQKYSVQK